MQSWTASTQSCSDVSCKTYVQGPRLHKQNSYSTNGILAQKQPKWLPPRTQPIWKFVHDAERQHDGKTSSHILRCKKNPEHNSKTLKEFGNRMSPQEYHPVFPLLKAGIWHGLRGESLLRTSQNSLWNLQTAFKLPCNQENIGWHNAVKGYMSVEWQKRQTPAHMGIHQRIKQETGVTVSQQFWFTYTRWNNDYGRLATTFCTTPRRLIFSL